MMAVNIAAIMVATVYGMFVSFPLRILSRVVFSESCSMKKLGLSNVRLARFADEPV
jgi:hypothetical protein